MNRDELVERVHSAIRAKLNHTPYMAPPDVLEECARAALAIIEPAVRELAADMLDGQRVGLAVTAPDAPEWVPVMLTNLAAAIRAGAKP